MLTTVFAKALRDRWLGMVIAVAAVGLWLPMAMAIYRDIDLSIYSDLPEGIRGLMGIPEGADAATLAYNVMLDFVAALTFAGLAVSMGSAAIAGEERKGTIGLLLGNPKSRSHVLASKTASMVVLVTLATIVLWGIAELTPVALDIEIGRTRLDAMMVHLGVNALFYGFCAVAIGSWTGDRTKSSAIPAGIMVVSYFAVGLLPLNDALAPLARAFPWYYFSSSDPLVNGVHWGHLAILGAGIAAFAAVSFVGLNGRDLRGPTVGVSALDRLRANPTTRRLFDRLAGSTRVSRIWVKTTSDHQALLLITAFVMFSMMGVLMGPMYTAIEADIADAAADFPEAMLAIAGNGDLSTPEGFFQVETFSLMAPIAVMVVTVTIGAKGIAGEEADGTMGLLLANPIPRSRIVLEQALAMTVYASVVAGATFAGVAIANVISSLEMSVGGIAATSVLTGLLGLLFGALALALSAATGRTRAAIYGTIGVALTSHLLNSFLPLSEGLAEWARLTPHYYVLTSDPLVNGMAWGHGLVLVAAAGVMIGIAVITFDRRDLRQP